MNILVTGANGQLGNEMRRIAAQSQDTYVFTDIVEQEGVATTLLDITDLEAVRRLVAEQHVQAIVNCAAYTNVDAAESNEALAERLNADAPENLAKAMEAAGSCRFQRTMSLAASPTTAPVARTRRVRQRVYMV